MKAIKESLKELTGIEIAIILVIVGIIIAILLSRNTRREACAQMMALARTNSDSIQVIGRCNVPNESRVYVR